MIEKKCYSCKSKDHYITKCPILTMNLNKEKVINNFIATLDFQPRKLVPRRKNKIFIKANNANYQKINRRFLIEKDDLCTNIVSMR